MLSFFPLDVLGEIWDAIESFSEGFLTYFGNIRQFVRKRYFYGIFKIKLCMTIWCICLVFQVNALFASENCFLAADF